MAILVFINLLILQGLVTLVNITVGNTAAAAFGWGNGTAVLWWSIGLSLTFIVASLLTHWLKSTLLDWGYTFAAYWFGLVHFLLMGAIVYYLVATSIYRANIYVSSALLAGISFGIFFLIHLYGTWNAGRAQVTRLTIYLEGLPAAWTGRKVAFVSDVHLGNVRGAGFAKKVSRTIERENPYSVWIGGDLYDGGACDEQKIIEPFRALCASRNVFYVTGNHEFYTPSVARALEAVKGVGMKILDDEAVELEGITLIGMDYKKTETREDFSAALKDVVFDPAKPSILLKHIPSDIDLASEAGISLELCGHTHQGQIFPLSFFTRTIYKGFDYGLKRFGAMQVFTSSGVGTWGPPLRLGTRSEIVIIEFA